MRKEVLADDGAGDARENWAPAYGVVLIVFGRVFSSQTETLPKKGARTSFGDAGDGNRVDVSPTLTTTTLNDSCLGWFEAGS